jgi:pimeloyl-ACP methyl ester carboxylesterase
MIDVEQSTRQDAAVLDSWERDGLRFDVTERGPSDGPVVLLLHGFPQTAASWEPVAQRLAAAGYRTLAPDQRGYTPSARPRGRRAYRVAELVADILALVDAAGAERVHVVGHDWGAVVAWAFAAAHPERTATVTGVSVPHPAPFLRAIATSRQALLSWYIYAFQLPGLPERYLTRPGALAGVLRRTGQTKERALRDVAALTARGGLGPTLTGAINWYRAMVLAGREMPGTVSVPAMLVWSDGDSAVSRTAVEGNAAWMSGPYRFEVLPGVSHWIPDEAPGDLADLVLDHVGSVPAGR